MMPLDARERCLEVFESGDEPSMQKALDDYRDALQQHTVDYLRNQAKIFGEPADVGLNVAANILEIPLRSKP